MASGAGVNSDCVTQFQQLKLGKQLKYVVFTMSDDNTEVVVKKTSSEKDYDTFLKEFEEDKCVWAVYDFQYDAGEGLRNKLTFISWTGPEVRGVKQKMIFSSSRNALSQALTGIHLEIQATGYDDLEFDIIKNRAMAISR